MTATPTPPPKGLIARAFGVLTSPRSTYADIAARPEALSALVTVFAIMATATAIFLSTKIGQDASVDWALDMAESYGRPVTDEMLTRMEAEAPYFVYGALASQVVLLPLVAAVIAGLSVGVFNAVFGADATFKQAFGIAAHSYFIIALQTVFVTPLNYAQESLSSATSLAVFLPFLDPGSFAGRFAGSIDFFRIWWMVSLAIGFGGLFRRETGPLAGLFLAIYVTLALAMTIVRMALSGA